MCVSLMRSCSVSSRVQTEPISTSPPPEGYLVSACITTSAPSANASKAMPAPQVLSMADVMPWSRHTRSKPTRSGNSIVTEPAASTHTSFVCGPTIAASAAASIGSYRRCVMPQCASSWRASSRLGP